jgi:hypothetical protein
VSVVQGLLSAQSALVVQQFAIGVCVHTFVVVLQASVVHALPSAQSALPRQHPVSNA